ncbi:hypothetical protein SH449x_004518 [Pirellulaceae bacterium SH449]
MSSLASHRDSFPVQMLERVIKQKPNYLLGVYGVKELPSRQPEPLRSVGSRSESEWQRSLEHLVESLAPVGNRAPVLIAFHDLFEERNDATVSRMRYGNAERVARWKTYPLCILDLGFNDDCVLKSLGRQCDGVALIASGNLKYAKRVMNQCSREAIPWIGYWTVATKAVSSDNPLDSLQKAG